MHRHASWVCQLTDSVYSITTLFTLFYNNDHHNARSQLFCEHVHPPPQHPARRACRPCWHASWRDGRPTDGVPHSSYPCELFSSDPPTICPRSFRSSQSSRRRDITSVQSTLSTGNFESGSVESARSSEVSPFYAPVSGPDNSLLGQTPPANPNSRLVPTLMIHRY